MTQTILIHARPLYSDGTVSHRGEELVADVSEAEAIGRWLLGTTLWIGTESPEGSRCDSVSVTVTTELDRYRQELLTRFGETNEQENR